MPRRIFATDEKGTIRMKAVIVELNGRFAAALDDSGGITKVANKHYRIGQVIDMKNNISPLKSVSKVAIAAAVVFCVVGLGGLGAYAYYQTPSTYVSFDINPSVELGVNAFDVVVSVDAVNEDGEALIEGQDLLGKDSEEAIENLVDSAIDKEYIQDDGSSVISVVVESDNEEKATEKSDVYEEHVNKAVMRRLKEAIVYKDCSDLGLRTEAKDLGISPGKLKHIKMLQVLDPTITVEDYKDAKISEIMVKARELIRNNPLPETGSTTDSTTGSGTDSTGGTTISKEQHQAQKALEKMEKAAEKIEKARQKNENNGKGKTSGTTSTTTATTSNENTTSAADGESTTTTESLNSGSTNTTCTESRTGVRSTQTNRSKLTGRTATITKPSKPTK